MTIEAEFWSGAGNTFTVIDNSIYELSKKELSKAAGRLCSGKEKTEGLLAIHKSDKYDFSALFFNPDGSNGMMCGNGGRCAVKFALDRVFFNMDKKCVTFEMAGTIYSAQIFGDEISLQFPPPKKLVKEFKISSGGLQLIAGFVDVGSEHIIIETATNFNRGIHSLDIKTIAPPIRNYEGFSERGANVNFYETLPDGTLALRTFERGVEDETGACGTGAISTALIAALNGDVNFPVRIIPTSGIPLIVDISSNLDNISAVFLKGGAEKYGYDTFFL